MLGPCVGLYNRVHGLLQRFLSGGFIRVLEGFRGFRGFRVRGFRGALALLRFSGLRLRGLGFRFQGFGFRA